MGSFTYGVHKQFSTYSEFMVHSKRRAGGIVALKGLSKSQTHLMKNLCNFEPQACSEIITSRNASSTCFCWPNFGRILRLRVGNSPRGKRNGALRNCKCSNCPTTGIVPYGGAWPF